ncbi:putative membrane protein [Sporomusaceae bacterium BoRhaA]|uniref:heparan-alpha-glucosaminide N-acetyltransferase n=1 Tax=Pelorhabdus rhamnosifermentans TaxID=2772457 RepID=UPI001C064372|nr:heparan-alpha-glucosaminide N-acetyltransferase [Pelorhabdus rhamnosifermentans]MBU2701049.1 putative membrane protein [Pelorhabdus rhamnosifermentans]
MLKTVNRIWEIDFLRGVAILLMIALHIIVDLSDFYNYQVKYLSGFWYVEGKVSAILFMCVAGISSTLSQNSDRHGCKVFLWGMILMIITFKYDTQTYIRFGILHFLGISLLSVRWIKRLPYSWLAVIALVSIILGQIFASRYTSLPYLLPIGLVTQDFSSMDYYPLFPWYGVFIVGVMLGKRLYQKEKRSYFSFTFAHPFVVFGQHSFIIYLIHQPILLALLYGIYKVKIFS